MPSPLATARSYLALTRWLGPWAREDRVPRVRRTELELAPGAAGERPFRAWWYLPGRRPRRAPTGAYLVVPGLHYAGPADPRMDRFCSVLASAGFAVLAPFLPDFTRLRVAPGLLGDTERAWDALLERPELPAGIRPGVFSISFGSLPAIHLASRAAARDRIGALVLFGGYASWQEAIDFSLTGEVDGVELATRDPLNQPVVFMNLIDDLDGAPADPAPLLAAWRRQVEATWGREEMKRGGYVDVARRIAAEVPAGARELFLVGCGVEPGGHALALRALERSRERTAFLDPSRYAGGVSCPVHLVHGVDDDVIPYVQSRALAAMLPAAARPRVHLTGLYAHTSQAGPRGGLPRELLSMTRILRAMVSSGAGST